MKLPDKVLDKFIALDDGMTANIILFEHITKKYGSNQECVENEKYELSSTDYYEIIAHYLIDRLNANGYNLIKLNDSKHIRLLLNLKELELYFEIEEGNLQYLIMAVVKVLKLDPKKFCSYRRFSRILRRIRDSVQEKNINDPYCWNYLKFFNIHESEIK